VSDPDDGRVYDLAMQFERTALSWQRTALALAVTGALLLRFAVTEQVHLWPAGVVVLLVAAAVWLAAARAYANRSGRRAGHVLLIRRVGQAVVVALIVLSVMSCYAVLLTI
jgi:uncharacterized membrane protein YidH (DUF202 family)